MVADLHSTEYRFLQHVPEHPNIVAVLGVIRACPLTENLVTYLPQAAREAASQINHRNGRTRFLPTTGLILERLPLTLEQHVAAMGDALDAVAAIRLGAQVVEALQHLDAHGVVHGDLKPNNCMVDSTRTPCRLVLVDFGCAVLRGSRSMDMNDDMTVIATESTNFSLGNQAHLAPEVLAALARKGSLSRDSREQIEVPLSMQSSFAAGVLLYELAMGLDSPVLGYPATGNSPADFETVDFSGLAEVAGREYASVVRGLLCYDPTKRLSITDAHRKMSQLAKSAAIETDWTSPEPKCADGAASGGASANSAASSPRAPDVRCLPRPNELHLAAEWPAGKRFAERPGGATGSECRENDGLFDTDDSDVVQPSLTSGVTGLATVPWCANQPRSKTEASSSELLMAAADALSSPCDLQEIHRELETVGFHANKALCSLPALVEAVVRILQGQRKDVSTVTRACQALQSLGSEPKNKEQFCRIGGFVTLAEVLVAHAEHSPIAVAAVLRTVRAMTQSSAENAGHFGHTGGIGTVVRATLIFASDASLAIATCRTLSSACSNAASARACGRAGAVQLLLRLLREHTGAPKVTQACFQTLGDLARSDRLCQNECGGTGCLATVVRALECCFTASTATAASLAILAITKEHTSNLVSCGSSGVVEVTVKMMHVHLNNTSVLALACSVLTRIASVEKNRLLFGACGGMEMTTEVLRMQLKHATTATAALGTIGRMCQNQAVIADRCCKSGGVEAVVHALELHAGNPIILRSASVAIAWLAHGHDGRKALCATCGGVTCLVRALNACTVEAETAVWACTAIGNLAMLPANRLKVEACGGIKSLLSLLQSHIRDLPAAKQATVALGNVGMCEQSKVACAAQNAVGILYQAMVIHSESAEFLEVGCRTVRNLTGHAGIQRQCISCGCAKMLIFILGNHRKLPVAVHACTALGNIASTPENARLCGSLGAIDAVFEVLQWQITNPLAVEAACRTLGNLSSDRQNRSVCTAHKSFAFIAHALKLHQSHAGVTRVAKQTRNTLKVSHCCVQ